jgi:hypothetical protein
VPGHRHCDSFRDTRAHHVPGGGATQVVEQLVRHAGSSAGGGPRPFEVADRLTVPVVMRTFPSFSNNRASQRRSIGSAKYSLEHDRTASAGLGRFRPHANRPGISVKVGPFEEMISPFRQPVR